MLMMSSCKSCKDKKNDETPIISESGPNVENTLGFGVLNKMVGIWNGPVSSTTGLGNYPEWIVDFRPISENQISAKNELQFLLNTKCSRSELVFAWNAMLKDFPKNRLDLLEKLKPNYRLFLLSNTNETHITEFEKSLFNQHGLKNLEPFFEKVYYSCRMNDRKPNPSIFEFVLKSHHLNPNETLFIDDSPQHIQGALSTGINAKYLIKNREVEDLIKELNLL